MAETLDRIVGALLTWVVVQFVCAMRRSDPGWCVLILGSQGDSLAFHRIQGGSGRRDRSPVDRGLESPEAVFGV